MYRIKALAESEGVNAVIRYEISDYFGIPDKDGKEKIVKAGPGFVKLDESPNAQVEEKPYVSDRTTSGIITGYQLKYPWQADIITNKEVIGDFYDISWGLKTGAAAERNYYRVDEWREVEATENEPALADSYPARKIRGTVQVDSTEGEGLSIVSMSGSFNAVGDPVWGVFNIKTLEFTSFDELNEESVVAP